MSIFDSPELTISGSRFTVSYHIKGDKETVISKANDICVEQTIEYPADLLPEGDIKQYVIGKIESSTQIEEERFEVVISYADELTGYELPQFINNIFGNISMKPNIRITELNINNNLAKHFLGPRFGVEGIRDTLKIHDRPLLSTAIKPLGLSSQQLADMAYQLTLGGIDIIKDDHGIANQSFAPFNERVVRVSEAVNNANTKTGRNTIYAPNITGPFEALIERAEFAKSVGASGLLVLPGILGFETVRRLADDNSINLPIIMHPAVLGSYVLSKDFGFSHFVLHGQLARLCGADISIIPNYIGRFSYSREDCQNIKLGCSCFMNGFRPIMPGVGGGITFDNFVDMGHVYGKDVAYLISGNLHRQGPNLRDSVKEFVEALEDLWV